MSEPLRVALAGLGTVGGGVIRLLDANRELIARRAGRAIEIVAVSARDRSKDRGVDLSRFAWVDDTTALATAGRRDVVVELIGGSDGPALTLARTHAGARQELRHREQGDDRASRARTRRRRPRAAGVALKFEAAVAGGIPVIKGLREGAAANEIARVYGILNGTCNFILSKMEAEGRDFAEVLAEAQALGFAEADPSFDIDGVDAAHKLSILASRRVRHAAGVRRRRGQRHPPPARRRHRRGGGAGLSRAAARAGGGGRATGCSSASIRISCRSIIRWRTSPDRLNAVVAEGNFVGRLLFQGAGAGDGPTASAVVADLIDIARGEFGPPFAMPAAALTAAAHGGQRRAARACVSALHRRGPGRRAGRDRRGDARRRRLDREPDPARGDAGRQRAGRDRDARGPGTRDRAGAREAAGIAEPRRAADVDAYSGLRRGRPSATR